MNWRFWRSPQGADSDTCSTLEPLLSLYSDGMASPAETRRVERHLGECPDCRRALRWMQATHVVISKRPVVMPPPDLHARIARAIAASAPEPVVFQTKRRPIVLRPAVWAAAASLAVMGIVAEYLNQSPEPMRPVSSGVPPPSGAAKPPTGATPHAAPAKPFAVAKSQPLRVKSRIRPPARLTDQSHIAVLPPRTTLPVRPVHTHESSPVMAQLPPAPSAKTLTIKHALPPRNAPKPSVFLAVRPKATFEVPRAVKSSHEDAAVREAKKPLTPPTEEHLNETAPPAEAASAPVQVAVNTEPSVPAEHSSHSGLLDGVKLRVATLNSVSIARKVYAAAYTSGTEKFVQMDMVHTPTSYPSH